MSSYTINRDVDSITATFTNGQKAYFWEDCGPNGKWAVRVPNDPHGDGLVLFWGWTGGVQEAAEFVEQWSPKVAGICKKQGKSAQQWWDKRCD